MINFASLSRRSNASIDIFAEPIETVLRFNAGFIIAFQTATMSWMLRRQEAAKEGIESFGRLVCCHDVGEAIAIQREWIERSLRRLDEDFRPFPNQAPDTAESEVDPIAPPSEAAVLLPALESENQSHAPEHTDQKNGRTKKKALSHRAKSARSSSHGRRR